MDKFDLLSKKIATSKEELLRLVNIYKFQNKKIVFSNGCFDIIHRGHIEYLAKAASFGDVMIIGLNTDSSVSRLKGENRPVQDEKARALVIASLSFVDNIILFDEDTPFELINYLKPDILVKGSDYSVETIVGADIVLENGGKVETIDLVEGYSTSNIIEKACN